MIQVERLTFAYSHSAPPVFEGFGWQVQRGEAWSVIGPSGCGKSTLLHLLAGLLMPTSGAVRVDGLPLTRPRPQTGLIIQDYGLLPWATVRENAELGLKVRGFYGADGIHAPVEVQPTRPVEAWLERLGLAEVSESYPARISGGQRQRTALARTLTLGPDLLLMDEPFSSLDAPTRESLQDLMLELRGENDLTLVVVTHAIEEAAALGQKILLLGLPPNTHAEVIENNDAGLPGYRDSVEFAAVTKRLRERLRER